MGHAGIYGALISEPSSAESDVGVIFMHNEGSSTMCGHGIIGLGLSCLIAVSGQTKEMNRWPRSKLPLAWSQLMLVAGAGELPKFLFTMFLDSTTCLIRA